MVYHLLQHYTGKNTPDCGEPQETGKFLLQLVNHCHTGCYQTTSGLLWTTLEDDDRVQPGLHDLPHLPLEQI